jgi:hypothetical protein
VGLDPGWLALLLAAEGAALGQAVICFRAPGRYPDKRRDVQDSIDEGAANHLTSTLVEVIERVDGLREPAHETEDGPVEVQPIGDVLASTDLHAERETLIDAFYYVTGARQCIRRCRHLYLAQGAALITAMLLLPVLLWPEASGDHIVEGAWLHVALTVLAIAGLSALALFIATIRADNELDKALVEQDPRREHIG